MICEIVSGVLVIDHLTAGSLPQPFEQGYSEVVVLGPGGAEIRQFERQGADRYTLHYERIPGEVRCLVPSDDCFGQLAQDRFLAAYRRAIEIDPLDVRRAVRLALKAMAVTG